MALERGVQPSELARIGCEYCAYCFDRALQAREEATLYRAHLEREQEVRQQQLRRSARTGVPAPLG